MNSSSQVTADAPVEVHEQPWPAGVLTALAAAGLDPADVRRVLDAALAEDLAYGPDATTAAIVPDDAVVTATFGSRQEGVLAGVPVVEALLRTRLTGAAVTVHLADGAPVRPGDVVLTVTARAAELLTVERTALNLITHLSGIATATRAWVDVVAGTGCRIRDTRKTLPGLRTLEKYAVRCGGGTNHRMGLGDAVLIKDNHVAVAGSITAAMDAAGRRAGQLPTEVEVDRFDQLEEAIACGADLVLLDNWTVEQCRQGVQRARGTGTRLEASGGLTLDVAAAYAATGVDFLAVGGLTHTVTALDLGLDIDLAGIARQ
ncbi:MAG TPA: carboxylating nicotinate-nucleotide diphosphorylase [Kineosporiaceae bacterium]|nr:carboxylating nicotinate-nucleotide diphosphorylase [Kineosporiaceae bacterium]